MTMRQQALVMNIVYDDEQASPPETWDWPTLLDCEPSQVSVLVAGRIITHVLNAPEQVDERDATNRESNRIIAERKANE